VQEEKKRKGFNVPNAMGAFCRIRVRVRAFWK